MYHFFDVEVAKDVGVNAAILYANIKYWCDKNRANNEHFHDGYYWTYNSKRAFSELLPYFTERQVKYALEQLVESGYIIKGNYNDMAYDRTLWYADIKTENEKSNDKSDTIEQTNMSNTLDNNVQPIPYINTDINNNILSNTKYSEADLEESDKDNSYSTDKVIEETVIEDSSSKKENKFDSLEEVKTKVEKKKKDNLYTKCIAMIDEYTNNPTLRDTLVNYLDYILEKFRQEGKVMYANQFKGMLNNLSKMEKQSEVVSQSITKGWIGFYPLKDYSNYNPDTNKSPQHKAGEKAKNADGSAMVF